MKQSKLRNIIKEEIQQLTLNLNEDDATRQRNLDLVKAQAEENGWPKVNITPMNDNNFRVTTGWGSFKMTVLGNNVVWNRLNIK